MFAVSVPGVDELERRMRPGAWSEGGFLGRDERLGDVLAADARTLAELGLNAKELAEPLALLVEAPWLDHLDVPPDADADEWLWESFERSKAELAELDRRFGPVEHGPFATRVADPSRSRQSPTWGFRSALEPRRSPRFASRRGEAVRPGIV
jgi:hypothetical protein